MHFCPSFIIMKKNARFKCSKSTALDFVTYTSWISYSSRWHISLYVRPLKDNTHHCDSHVYASQWPCMHIAYCEPADCPRVSQLHVTLLSLLDLAKQHELFTVIHLLKPKNKRCHTGVGSCLDCLWQLGTTGFCLKVHYLQYRLYLGSFLHENNEGRIQLNWVHV